MLLKYIYTNNFLYRVAKFFQKSYFSRKQKQFYEEMSHQVDNKGTTAHHRTCERIITSGTNMLDLAKSTKRGIDFQLTHRKIRESIHVLCNNFIFYSKQNTKTQPNYSRFSLKQSLWSTMAVSLRLFIVLVISCMTEFAIASNGSSRNGGVVSNSVPRDGPYKNAQSAASVSNIVNGHYQTIEEDEEIPPVSILSDR